MFNSGGIMWLIIDVGLVAIFGGALAYAIIAWRQRPLRADTQGERKAHDIYQRRDPEENSPTS